MTRIIWIFVAILIAAVSAQNTPAVADVFPNSPINGRPSTYSWKALRDFRVVKQDLDYSCGAASLATILNEFYSMSVTEEDVLTRMGAADRSSFQQLADVAPSYGVKAGGLMLSFDDLKQLQVPAIAYVQYRGEDHFTVIRGIRRDGVVHVADPSWGNRQLTAHQFRQMWEATDTDGTLRGRILLLIPQDMEIAQIDQTFFAKPQGWSLTLRAIPLGR
ncbi:C39 family peptidase [Paracoccus zhouxuedongae]|uniref:C39 family peptidase n=1 Tax=Paracoccus sp. p4-l81 TaxID=3342806 RepID=UPI0035BC5815